MASTKRSFIIGALAGLAAGTILGAGGYRLWRDGGAGAPFGDVMDAVLPAGGIDTGVAFRESLQRIIAAGALVPAKLRAVYARRGGMKPWLAALLAGPSGTPIRFTADAANDLLTLLWPVGLATKAPFNAEGPTAGAHLPRLASTAGWTLGQEPNGAAYFDSVETLALSRDQAALVEEIASRTFRPCCDNPALFQDCNHGAAMLGLLELGASQGLDEGALERVALAANSYWFPREHLKTALYFRLFEGRAWHEVPPAALIGARYASASGWQENVNMALLMTSLIPRQSLIRMNGAMCRL